MKQLYLDTESADEYYRDRCVFADEIDIYDTMNAKGRLQDKLIYINNLTKTEDTR